MALNLDSLRAGRGRSRVGAALIDMLEKRLLLSASITTLATFDSTNGSNPTAGLVFDSTGNLYGVTSSGGAGNSGTLFKIDTSHVLTTPVTFNVANGATPKGTLVIDSQNNLFGTTQSGGATNLGTVFELDNGSSDVTTLRQLTNVGGSVPVFDGAFPFTGLISDTAGDLFGVGASGGASGAGAIFELAAGSHAFSTLASFGGSLGSTPKGGLVEDSSGNFYGTTSAGGDNGVGTVYELTGTTLTTLVAFNSTNGANPVTSLVMDSAGNFYGTTTAGGSTDLGTVFEISASSHTLSTLVTFSGPNGYQPYGNLIIDANGNLYGTTNNGGANGDGTIFEIDTAHTLTTLASFNGTDGANPQAGLIADSSGNLYGTTVNGGTSNLGTVFELTGSSVVATRLVVSAQPSATNTSHTISPPVTVSLEDLSNTVVTSGNAMITVSIGTGTAGAKLGGTLSEPMVNGVATFSDLSLDTAGTYTLSFSDGVDAPIASDPFAITAGPSLSSTIVKSTLPKSVVAGAPIKGGNVTVNIHNATAAQYSGPTTVGIYATTNGVVDANAKLLNSVTPNLQIKANGSTTITVPIGSLPATLNGVYTLVCRTIEPSRATAVSAAGPSLTVASPFVEFSETSIQTTQPPTSVSGAVSKGVVRFNVVNRGNIPSSGASFVDVLASPDGNAADGIVVATTRDAIVLKPNASKAISLVLKNLPAVGPGTYYFVVRVTDAQSQVTSAATSARYTLAPSSVAFSESSIQTTLAPNSVVGATPRAVVRFNVTNSGNIASSGSSTVEILASADGNASDGTLIGSMPDAIILNPRARKTISVPLSNLSSLAAGSYYLVVRVTDSHFNITSAATPAKYTLAAPLVGFSEGSIQTTQPANSISGTPTNAVLRFDVTNIGNITSSGSSRVDVLASPDGTIADGIVVGSMTASIILNPKARKTLTVPLTNFPNLGPGTYKFFVRITDPITNITFAKGPSFTLAAPFVALSESALETTEPPTILYGASSKAVVRVKVTNRGNISSTPVSVSVIASSDGKIADGTPIGYSVDLPPLKPNASKSVTVSLGTPVSLSPGSYYLIAVVTDDDFNIDASDSTAAQYKIIVGAPALDLATGHLLKNNIGGALLFLTVKNTGTLVGDDELLQIDATPDGNYQNPQTFALDSPSINFDVPPAGKKLFLVPISAAELSEVPSGWQIVVNLAGGPTILKFPG